MGIFKLKKSKQQSGSSSAERTNDQEGRNNLNSFQQQRQQLENTGPSSSSSIEAEIASLSDKQRFCFDSLKIRWQERVGAALPSGKELPFLSDDMILRFAQCAPAGPFNEHSAWKTMKNYASMYHNSLTFVTVKDQLQTRTLFPLDGVHTMEGNKVFYMRPSRYNPKVTPVQDIIDNLVYVMTTMNEDRTNVTRGIAFIANMDGWTMNNFSMDYCIKFMQVLQGSIVPTKVTHFFIVNPPKWFGKVYAVMKKTLSPSFQKKVKIIPERKLVKYLQPGYHSSLPAEMKSGNAKTHEIVEDYSDYRRYIESKQQRQQREQERKKVPLEELSEHTTLTVRCEDDPTDTLSSIFLGEQLDTINDM